jgi:hypothetical protein
MRVCERARARIGRSAKNRELGNQSNLLNIKRGLVVPEWFPSGSRWEPMAARCCGSVRIGANGIFWRVEMRRAWPMGAASASPAVFWRGGSAKVSRFLGLERASWAARPKMAEFCGFSPARSALLEVLRWKDGGKALFSVHYFRRGISLSGFVLVLVASARAGSTRRPPYAPIRAGHTLQRVGAGDCQNLEPVLPAGRSLIDRSISRRCQRAACGRAPKFKRA